MPSRISRPELQRISAYHWRIEPSGSMRVPVVVYADDELARSMDTRALVQACEVAQLPGIVEAAYAMPDAHWGFGFPSGSVAAFDLDAEGVLAAGGVGLDIANGARLIHTGLDADAVLSQRERLADALYAWVPPASLSPSRFRLSDGELEGLLTGGARRAVGYGWGDPSDLESTEDRGRVYGADPDAVSRIARARERRNIGTLGQDEHYIEVDRVAEIADPARAQALGLAEGQATLSIHGGSHGLGHQIGTDYHEAMLAAISSYGPPPSPELAFAPIESPLGRRFFGALRAGINGALANRQIMTHLARHAFAEVLPQAALQVVCDSSCNTCRQEAHIVDGRERLLYVHRKEAAPVFTPRDHAFPTAWHASGQPLIIGEVMGAESWVVTASDQARTQAFGSIPCGTGHSFGGHATIRRWRGPETGAQLSARGITTRSPSLRGAGEEAPGSSARVRRLVEIIEQAGFIHRVARLEPLICTEG
ncbi:MAG: RtcB family protein [Halofilum sp. (in: g-proteobacteria)]